MSKTHLINSSERIDDYVISLFIKVGLGGEASERIPRVHVSYPRSIPQVQSVAVEVGGIL